MVVAVSLFAAPALAQIDNIEARFVGEDVLYPDVVGGNAGMILSGTVVSVFISNQTNSPWDILTAPFVIYSPDASITSLTYLAPPTILPEWPNSGADFLGEITLDVRIAGGLPDTIWSGWHTFTTPYESPELSDVLLFRFLVPEGTTGELCLDTGFVPPNIQYYTSAGIPQWGGSVGGYPDGGLCFTVIDGYPDCCELAGDANHDGSVNISDAITLIYRIFNAGPHPLCCREADADGDGMVTIADVVYHINYAFNSGPAPTCGPPGMTCGP
ncbi:MAG TPA: dockerin type I domain-containing protein [candidate division Zixibacteria bacterium]|nr:dockerin type I domain-containing protein [candidate division Zixibacteria bacterium]